MSSVFGCYAFLLFLCFCFSVFCFWFWKHNVSGLHQSEGSFCRFFMFAVFVLCGSVCLRDDRCKLTAKALEITWNKYILNACIWLSFVFCLGSCFGIIFSLFFFIGESLDKIRNEQMMKSLMCVCPVCSLKMFSSVVLWFDDITVRCAAVS